MAISAVELNRIRWREGLVLEDSDVGLSAGRPFRFCTIHYGQEVQPPVFFGDDPEPSGTRTVEIFLASRQFNYEVPRHSHTFYEIALIHQGTLLHTAGGRTAELGRGDVVLVAPGAFHAYSHISNVTKTNLYLHREWFFDDLRLLWWEQGLVRRLLATALFDKQDLQRLITLKLSDEQLARCEQELTDMRGEAQRQCPSLLAFHAGLLKMLTILNQAYEAGAEDAAPPLQASLWETVSQIEDCIKSGAPLNVSALAGRLNMSSTHFCRMFSDATGLAPSAYFQKRRLQHAVRMLLEPDKSITAIACLLGFSDAAHFSRSFKAAHGQSPSQYRRQHRRTA